MGAFSWGGDIRGSDVVEQSFLCGLSRVLA